MLLVLQVEDTSIQRITLQWDTTFKLAVNAILMAVPCIDIPQRPILAYKLSSAAVKIPFVTLKTDEDWDGLRETIILAEGGKKLKGQSLIPVNIELGPSGVSLIYFLHNVYSALHIFSTLNHCVNGTKKERKGKWLQSQPWAQRNTKRSRVFQHSLISMEMSLVWEWIVMKTLTMISSHVKLNSLVFSIAHYQLANDVVQPLTAKSIKRGPMSPLQCHNDGLGQMH